MDAACVADIVAYLQKHGLEIYVDGGWAVDALLGDQSRPHGDLDIAIPHKQVSRLRELLALRGYDHRPRAGSRDCNFVLADPHGREIDVHSYTLNEAGECVFGIPYARQHLLGTGSIGGYQVRCISPEWLVKFHTGYEPDYDDFRDVFALCNRFRIALPAEYQKFLGAMAPPEA